MEHWPMELEETLRAMWAEGRSAREIGEVVGKPRNAVLGKANRLGLSKHPSLAQKKLEIPRKPVNRSPEKRQPLGIIMRKAIKQPASVPDITVTSSGVAFADLPFRGFCKAIVGRDAESPRLVRFCGHPSEDKSYCPHHYKEYYYSLRR